MMPLIHHSTTPCRHIYIYIYIYGAVFFPPKRDEHHSKEMGFKCKSQICILCLLKEHFIYVNIHIYVYKSPSQNTITEIVIDIGNPFLWNGNYRVLEASSSCIYLYIRRALYIYISIQIYMYTHGQDVVIWCIYIAVMSNFQFSKVT